MKKPALLRKALANTFPDLAKHPAKLTLYIIDGGIEGQKGTLSHTKHYKLRVLITDWSEPMDESPRVFRRQFILSHATLADSSNWR